MKILFSNQAPFTWINRLFEFIVLLIQCGIPQNRFHLVNDTDYELNWNPAYQTEHLNIVLSERRDFFELKYHREYVLVSGSYNPELNVYVAEFHHETIKWAIKQCWPLPQKFHERVLREKFQEIVEKRTANDLYNFCVHSNVIAILPNDPCTVSITILDHVLLRGDINKLNLFHDVLLGEITLRKIPLDYYKILLKSMNRSGFTPLMNAVKNGSQDSVGFIRTFFCDWIEDAVYNKAFIFSAEEIKEMLSICFIAYEKRTRITNRFSEEIYFFLKNKLSHYNLNPSVLSEDDSTIGSSRTMASLPPYLQLPERIYSSNSMSSIVKFRPPQTSASDDPILRISNAPQKFT